MPKKVQIVGILNTTPDSYFDGGQFVTPDQALKHAQVMLAEGADIIEVGGESTGPGSINVSLAEELERTIPVIKTIKEQLPSASIAIDTYKAPVAQQAIAAGASMVNDVTAGRGDPDMFSTIADSPAELVLMYAKDTTPRTTKADTTYDNVIATIKQFLTSQIDQAIKAGVPKEKIIIDPGLGHFVSSLPEYSFEIIAHLPELTNLGYPIFISPSRKSFLAGSESLKTANRLPGTIAASAIAVLNGATYIRTHDVAAVRRACEITQAIKSSGN